MDTPVINNGGAIDTPLTRTIKESLVKFCKERSVLKSAVLKSAVNDPIAPSEFDILYDFRNYLIKELA